MYYREAAGWKTTHFHTPFRYLMLSNVILFARRNCIRVSSPTWRSKLVRVASFPLTSKPWQLTAPYCLEFTPQSLKLLWNEGNLFTGKRNRIYLLGQMERMEVPLRLGGAQKRKLPERRAEAWREEWWLVMFLLIRGNSEFSNQCLWGLCRWN